jgi:hypothetical protein
MNLIWNFVHPILIIAIGVGMKRSSIVVNESLKKTWWVFILLGCLDFFIQILQTALR